MQAPIRNNLKKLDISFNLLTEFPSEITYLENLRILDINSNEIDFLPKKLGTLPHLTRLNFSSNHLGKSNHNTWKWLEQATVRYKLGELDLSSNLLTELPPQIGNLNALTLLRLAYNKLKCLPHSLGNLKKLKQLDLFNNDLLYLPGSVGHLSACIIVEGNPFNLNNDNDDDLITNLKVPSLLDCSAEFILKTGNLDDYISRLKNREGLSPELVKYLNEEKYCFFCETPCFRYYGKRFINYSVYDEVLDLELTSRIYHSYISPNVKNVKIECYACSSECAKRLRFD
ncbi:leucine-rich repeat-containing protein 18-like [Linepithema humile]|uniref:leucine-rich repeat-containing protein 18-like n=1 Tax=Linepithema humile TaxID=83485 RepID=UPI00351E8D25